VKAARLAPAAFVLLSACGPKVPPPPPPPPPVPLHLDPACDLAPAAGLSWLVSAEPRTIAQIPDLIPALSLVFPEERLQRFAAAHGGIDLRQVTDLCVAHYRETTLAVARVPLDDSKVIAGFDARSTRTPVKTEVAPSPHVFRETGEEAGLPTRIVVFGREAIAYEQGAPGPLRAAEAFAFGKLKRAQPALRSSALLPAAAALGPAPVRIFAPGPFEGESAQALGGLLRAATAIGASARWGATQSQIALRIVVLGAWGPDAPAAAERLGAAAHVLAESPAGRLFGLGNPIDGPHAHGEGDVLSLDVTIDGDRLARGVRDAVDAEVDEILRSRP
jgi:hypothetical protein